MFGMGTGVAPPLWSPETRWTFGAEKRCGPPRLVKGARAASVLRQNYSKMDQGSKGCRVTVAGAHFFGPFMRVPRKAGTRMKEGKSMG